MSALPWQLAEPIHVRDIDFSVLFAGLESADARYYGEALAGPTKDMPDDDPRWHVLIMLSSLLQMYPRPADPNEPYGAMIRIGDRRTAEPADFAETMVETLVACSEVVEHPVVLARICDVAWFLERRRRDVGMQALNAYIQVIEKLESGALKEDGDDGLFGLSGHDLLQRALFVSRGLGFPGSQHNTLKKYVKRCRIEVAETPHPGVLYRFCALDLDWQASDASDVGDMIGDILTAERADMVGYTNADLWKLASRAYHAAKDETRKHECQAAAAESYVRSADTFVGKPGGAIQASHWLSKAIAQYHGHPDARERRKALKHRLIDVQDDICDDLQTISTPLDFQEIAEAVQQDLNGLGLLDLLLLFADLERSPNPEKIIQEAREVVAEAPLSSMFATSIMDSDGKTVAKSPGMGLSDEPNAAALLPTIHQSDRLRREIVAKSTLEVARAHIIQQGLSLDRIAALLAQSPCVPPALHMTIARGFLRFFEGDRVGALHILTPMLEGILRHVLKGAGRDVSTFDNATQTQEDRTISSLFDAMRTELDDTFGRALTEDIERVFLSKFGPSIRHRVAHALHDDGTPYGADAIYANWLIWRICCIPLFPHRDSIVLP